MYLWLKIRFSQAGKWIIHFQCDLWTGVPWFFSNSLHQKNCSEEISHDTKIPLYLSECQGGLPINNMASGWFSFSFSESISLSWILIRTCICCVPVTFNRIKQLQLCEDIDLKQFEAGLCKLSKTERIFYLLTCIFTVLTLKIGMNSMYFFPSQKHFLYNICYRRNKKLIFYYNALIIAIQVESKAKIIYHGA